MNETTTQIRKFLEAQRSRLTRDQWQQSYQSWAHAGTAWNRYGMGGTDICTALTWYQHVYRPGSREWRPSIIMLAVCRAMDQVR